MVSGLEVVCLPTGLNRKDGSEWRAETVLSNLHLQLPGNIFSNIFKQHVKLFFQKKKYFPMTVTKLINTRYNTLAAIRNFLKVYIWRK
jgi:hypothetical protein